jgi:hypothetical protein
MNITDLISDSQPGNLLSVENDLRQVVAAEKLGKKSPPVPALREFFIAEYNVKLGETTIRRKLRNIRNGN